MAQDDTGQGKRLPLDGWHRAHGARMIDFAGYKMPVQYDGIIAEHVWTRNHAGLFDVSHMGQLRLTGEGNENALEAVTPGDFLSLEPGRMRYSLLLNEHGGIIDDLMVTRLGDHLFLVVNAATKHSDLALLRAILPPAVSLGHLDQHALLALQGPEAQDVLARHVPRSAGLTFMQAAFLDWQGHDLLVSRSGYTGEDGFEVSLPAAAAQQFADTLLGDERVRPAGLGARDSLRLEAGLPLYGHDLDTSIDPVSAGLAFAISPRRRQEGGYPGAERIGELLARGPQRLRVGLELTGRQPAREGAAVLAGEREIGRVTSGGFSPTLGRPIAMAYVTRDCAAPGTPLTVLVRDRRLDAAVVPLPFVPHRYYRRGTHP